MVNLVPYLRTDTGSRPFLPFGLRSLYSSAVPVMVRVTKILSEGSYSQALFLCSFKVLSTLSTIKGVYAKPIACHFLLRNNFSFSLYRWPCFVLYCFPLIIWHCILYIPLDWKSYFMISSPFFLRMRVVSLIYRTYSIEKIWNTPKSIREKWFIILLSRSHHY